MNLKKIALLLIVIFISIGGFGQESGKKNKKITVTGTVLDQAGQPLSNVPIFIDGKNSNRLSDTNGSFKIKVKPGAEIISVFSLLYGGQEVVFEGQTEINFVVTTDPVLEQIRAEETGEVVDVGYSSAQRDNLTSSVGSVDKDKIKNTNYLNIFDMLIGEIPGVTVSGSQVRIRGTSSINGSNQPLFIVNGSPVSSIGHISPRDVKSIDVLKGSSTAIYGVRGANGVILIKLK